MSYIVTFSYCRPSAVWYETSILYRSSSSSSLCATAAVDIYAHGDGVTSSLLSSLPLSRSNVVSLAFLLLLFCQNACTIGTNDASHLPRLVHPTYITCEPKFPRLFIAMESQLGERRDNISKHPNHSWRNDYD